MVTTKPQLSLFVWPPQCYRALGTSLTWLPSSVATKHAVGLQTTPSHGRHCCVATKHAVGLQTTPSHCQHHHVATTEPPGSHHHHNCVVTAAPRGFPSPLLPPLHGHRNALGFQSPRATTTGISQGCGHSCAAVTIVTQNHGHLYSTATTHDGRSHCHAITHRWHSVRA